MFKNQLKFIVTIILVLGLSISFQSLLAAWQAPSVNPPGGNISKPINEGYVHQVKNGSLDINGVGGLGVASDVVIAGRVGIGTGTTTRRLQVGGDVEASAFYYSSDESLKKNVQTLENSLNKILNLRGVSFDWKSDDSENIGLIAQEVEKIFPELVGENSKGLKSVEYANLVAPIIEAIKEQQKIIENLEKEINSLKK